MTEAEVEQWEERRVRVTRGDLLVWLVTLMTLGSGVVSLYSVILPDLPERHALMRDIFPLEFLHLSRFLTVVTGFSLVISSLNIYRRKRRAYWGVLGLGLLSVVFHLTKALDYEEALFSLVLVGLLWVARSHFIVRSGLPDPRGTGLRLAAALVVAFGYGVAGFWFLDPREFGLNFTLVDSIGRTVRFLALQGDPQIVPRTHFATWFLDSLFLMTVTAVGYLLFAVFRPVVHRYRTLPHERAAARSLVERHGRCALEIFKCWPDKSFFFSPSGDAFLAFRVSGGFAVVLGDPVGPEEELEGIVRSFSAICRESGWKLGFHQVLPDLLPLYHRLGFRRIKVGDDAIVDLTAFTLDGHANKTFRNRLNRLEKDGIQFVRYAPPLEPEVIAQAREVSDEWLGIPGRRERTFTLGAFETDYVQASPLVAALEPDGRMLAFLNEIPSYHPGESSIDLMRHRQTVPNGIMDYLFVKHFLALRERGFTRFNMGMAPLSSFQEREGATREEQAIRYFVQHLDFLFRFSGIHRYKAKFASSWDPRFAIYQNPLDLPRLVIALGRVGELPRHRRPW